MLTPNIDKVIQADRNSKKDIATNQLGDASKFKIAHSIVADTLAKDIQDEEMVRLSVLIWAFCNLPSAAPAARKKIADSLNVLLAGKSPSEFPSEFDIRSYVAGLYRGEKVNGVGVDAKKLADASYKIYRDQVAERTDSAILEEIVPIIKALTSK